jgi:hypothetical protein
MKIYISVIMLLFCISSSAIAQNLRFHLDFNNNTTDVTGNNTGIVYGNPVFVAGSNGQANTALRFDGVNDYLVFPPNTSLDFDSGFTIFVRIKPNGFYTGTCHGNMILSKGSVRLAGHYGLIMSDDNYNRSNGVSTCATTTVNTTKETFEGSRNTLGTTFGNVNENTPPNYGNLSQNVVGYSTYTNAALPIVISKWNCVKYTFNKGSGISKLFVNDSLVGTNVNFPNFVSNNNEDFTVGRQIDPSYPTYTYQLNADIDDIKIYDGPIEATKSNGDNNYLACNAPLAITNSQHLAKVVFLSIYNNGNCTLQYNIDYHFKTASINLYDVSGKLISKTPIQKSINGLIAFDALGISKGIYFAKLVVDGNGIAVQKVSIQ